MIHQKTMDKFLVRAQLDVGAYGNYRTSHDLIDAEAIAAARCALVNGEMETFTHFCYQKEGNWFRNLSGNSQIPSGTWAPWGSSGKGRLSRMERDTVRAWLNALARNKAPKPLYFYSRSARRWHVDTLRYPTLDDALEWLRRTQLDPKTWLQIEAKLKGIE